jgi:hypothetical protein
MFTEIIDRWVSNSGSVIINYSYTLNGKHYNDLHFIENEKQEMRWIDENNKTLLLVALENWIGHKIHVHGNKIKTSEKIGKAMQRCLEILHKSPENSLKNICIVICRSGKYFENIMPSAANPSYTGSREKLNQILEFSTRQNRYS